MSGKLVRCIEGHVYDMLQHDSCPVCGARVRGQDDAAAIESVSDVGGSEQAAKEQGGKQSFERRGGGARLSGPRLASGIVIALVVLGAGVWLLNPRDPERPTKEAVTSAEGVVPPASSSRFRPGNNSEQPAAQKSNTVVNESSARPAKADPPASHAASECDRLAMSPLDPDRVPGTEGVLDTGKIDAARAVPVCEAAAQAAPAERRLWVNLARSYRAAKKETAAAETYRKAAKLGSVFGAYGLGLILRDNLSMQSDPGEARRFLEQAAQDGFIPAMLEYANMLDSGTGGPADLAQAQHWYEQAAGRGQPTAMNLLGVYLATGKGGETDLAKATDLFERAAKLSSADALANLGALYEVGKGVERNVIKARSLYEEAAKNGSTLAMRRLTTLAISGGNVQEGLRWLNAAVDAGDAEAVTQLGRLYRDGKINGKPDYVAARQWFEKAAERGDSDALNELGYLYQVGLGVKRDYEAARVWYEKGAQRGDPWAMARLGVLYEYGAGVPQNFIEARRLHETAASRGNTYAMMRLGEMAEKGKGTGSDIARARDWYTKAGDRGNPNGYWRAMLLTDKHGINPDRATLAQYALRSAKAGSEEAKQGLLENPERSLSPELRSAIERALAQEGYYEGPATGRFEPKVKEAIRDYFAGPPRKNRL